MRVPTALRLYDGNDRDELFLCLLHIKFWVLIFIWEPTWQSCDCKLQYNTCRRGMRSLLCLTTCLSSLFRRLTTCVGWRVPSLFSVQSFSAGGANFERFCHQKSWPHINHSVLGFDHIFDHKQIRSTRRQDVTRVWKSRFCVAERARKSKNG